MGRQPRSLFSPTSPRLDAMRRQLQEHDRAVSDLAMATRDVVACTRIGGLTRYQLDLVRGRQRDALSHLIRCFGRLVVEATNGAELCALDSTASSSRLEAVIADNLVTLVLADVEAGRVVGETHTAGQTDGV